MAKRKTRNPSYNPYNPFTEQANSQFINNYAGLGYGRSRNIDTPWNQPSTSAKSSTIYGKGANMLTSKTAATPKVIQLGDSGPPPDMVDLTSQTTFHGFETGNAHQVDMRIVPFGHFDNPATSSTPDATPAVSATASEVASDVSEATSAASSLSGAALGGLAFLGSAAVSGGIGLIQSMVSKNNAEDLMHTQYGIAKQAAHDSGMPLANVLGFGASLPPSKNYIGAASTTTKGQGMMNPQHAGTLSQVTNGYGQLW